MNSKMLQNILYILKGDISQVYLTVLLRTMFAAMITIFVPIYLLAKSTPILYIPIFYIVKAIVGIPLLLLVRKFTRNAGLPFPMILSSFVYIMFLFSLSKLPINLYTILLFATESELADILFWIPFHQMLVSTTYKEIREKEIDIINALISTAPLLSPLIAAIIITNFGYENLFIIAGIGTLLSVIPIAMSHNFKQYDSDGNRYSLSIKYLAEGIRGDSLDIYWPLFIFLVLSSVEQLGTIITIGSIIGAVSLIIVGYIDNKDMQNKFLKIGGMLHYLTLVIRGFLNSFTSILTIMACGTIANSILISPYLAKYYDNLEKDNSELAKREINLRVGRTLSGCVLLLLLYFMPGTLPFAIFFIIVSPTSLLMSKED